MTELSGKMKVGGVKIQVTDVSESGGMKAPSKSTEKGYDFSTRAKAQNKSVTVKGFVKFKKYSSLDGLRNKEKPVKIKCGFVNINKATVDDVSVNQQASKKTHFKVSIKLTETRTATTGTSTIEIEPSSGGGGGGGGGGGKKSSSSEVESPTLAQTNSEDTGGDGGGGGGGGGGGFDPLGDITGWLGL